MSILISVDLEKRVPDAIGTVDVGTDHQLYCWIKSGSVKAKFERKVYYELMKKLTEKDGYYGLVLHDKFYPVQLATQVETDNGFVSLPSERIPFCAPYTEQVDGKIIRLFVLSRNRFMEW